MTDTVFTAISKQTGEVLYSGTAYNPSVFSEGDTVVLEGKAYGPGYVIDNIHYKLPPQPSTNHTFNYTTKQWEDPRTLQDIKDAQWTLIKQARSNAEYAGFTWDGSTFDSDAISQNRITGAVALAQLSTGFVVDWTLADNSTRTLNQIDMLHVGAALGEHVQTQFAKGQVLRAQIDAATTKAEVEAVVW
ncbi:MAG: DUF4376 domain-containing protein [Candidatus Moranbacteria bacterium]|nr:DUF4376 domain-containing protein [Candidatus Moranbacteria bacterium]